MTTKAKRDRDLARRSHGGEHRHRQAKVFAICGCCQGRALAVRVDGALRLRTHFARDGESFCYCRDEVIEVVP
jgi:hypothetical protein